MFTISDLNLSDFDDVHKIEGDIIEIFNMVNIGTTVRVRYNENSCEVYFIKVNGKEITRDNPENIVKFNEALEALFTPGDKKSFQ